MKETMIDKVVSKVSKGKINTVRVTREEMVEMVDKYFIQAATTDADRQDIWKVIKRGIFLDKILDSKDGNYQMRSQASQGRAFKKYIWILDRNADKFYEYNYYVGFYGGFKRSVKDKLVQAYKK